MRLLRYGLVVLLATPLCALAQPTFTEITEGDLTAPLTGWSISWVDFDGDADLDLFASRFATTGGNALFRNDDGLFVSIEAGDLVTGPGSIGHSWADFDNDGDLDVATTSPSQSTPNLRLYQNDTNNGNGWLKLNLKGTASNRSGIGAKVRATASIAGVAVTQFREVSAQNTFGGQNALTVHFGLGDAASVDLVEITWPSGALDTFEGVARNAFFEATEGGDLVAVAAEPDGLGAVPAFGLAASYPNPFAERATIPYRLGQAGTVSLVVYDLLGRRVRTLVDGQRPAGPHSVTWDGTDASGRRLSAGVYLYRLEAGGQAETRRLVLVR